MATGIHSGISRSRKNNASKPSTLAQLKERLRQPYVLVALFAVLLCAGSLWGRQQLTAPVSVFGFDLSSDDVVAMQRELTQSGFEFKVDPTGKQILVSPSSLPLVKLHLAREGYPRHSRPQEETSFGTSSEARRRQYHERLSGEIESTLHYMPQVAQARVHLSYTGNDRLFEAPAPTAAVVLTLKQGEGLSRDEVQGVVRLVASSVADLEDQRVTVLDGRGNPLEVSSDQELPSVDRALEVRVQEILRQVLGPERVHVVVTTEWDHSRERAQEHDVGGEADQLLSGIQDLTEKMDRDESGEAGFESKKRAAKRVYDQSFKEVEYTEPRIQRRSVAVMAHNLKPELAARVEEFVATAVGLDRDGRGDQVTVESVPFHMPIVNPDGPMFVSSEPVASSVPWPLLGLGSLTAMALFGFLRRYQQAPTGGIEAKLAAMAPAQTVCDLNQDRNGPAEQGADETTVANRMATVCSENPRLAVGTLRSYLN